MEHIFLCILSLSLSGTLAGIVLLLIHPLTKKYFSKRWNYYIWLLVVASLLFPVQFQFASSSKFDLHKSLSSLDTQQIQPSQSLSETNEFATYTMTNSTAQTDTNLSLTETSNTTALPLPQEKLFLLKLVNLAELWLLGVLLTLFLKLWNYLRFSICLKNNRTKAVDAEMTTILSELSIRLSMKKMPEIYESTIVSSPITFGLWNPVVILPSEDKTAITNKYQIMLALHHELLHVKRKDLWYKWMYQILLCIHWFNPILYVIGRTLNEDCELSCDEALLRMLTEDGKKTYGNILIDIAQRNISSYSVPCTTLLERKKDLKERLNHILNYKKQTKRNLFLSVCMFVIMLSVTACSNALSATVFPIPTEQTAQKDNPAPANKNGEAWKVYDDEKLLAGEDICDYQWFNNYYGYDGTKIKCSEMFLNGSNSTMIIYAEAPAQIQVNSSFTVAKGKFKLVSIAPDGTVALIDDSGTSGKHSVTLQQGRNVIKMVGQDAKVTSLNLSYDNLDNKAITDIYSSKTKETTALIAKDLEAGTINMNIEELIDALPYIESDTVSNLLNSLLEQGVSLREDELEELFLHSDKNLSSRYLIEAIQDNKTEHLELESLINLLPYMDTGNRDTLMLTLIDELRPEILIDNIFYLSTGGRSQCLTAYLNAGNTLTASQYEEILPYLDSTTRAKILLSIPDEEFTFELLENCLPYLSTEKKEQFVINYIEAGNTLTYSQFDDISPYLNDRIIEKIDNLMK